MRIGEVAAQTGVGVETMRCYELTGLILRPLSPSAGGFRDHSLSRSAASGSCNKLTILTSS